MKNSLTILHYTSNVGKPPFLNKIRKTLSTAAKDYPIISISQVPMDFGKNICVGNIGASYLNIYKQMLIGARAADTEFVAMAEDDVLFHESHFNFDKLDPDKFNYNINKWGIYTWGETAFSLKQRCTNVSLIAPRKLLISAMEERFAKYPDESKINLSFWAEPGRYEKQLGVTVQPINKFETEIPVVVFSHPKTIGYSYLGSRKKLGTNLRDELPYWGKAVDILNLYWGTE